MPVKVRCPNCEKILNAPDAARGKAVKCPGCESRVPVPAAKKSAATTGKASGKSARPVKRKKPVEEDEDDFLSGLDLDKIEDQSVKLCHKCGAEIDESDYECPDCGIDLRTGQQGAKARRAARKGPDPAKFYRTAWSDCWNFTMLNKGLTIRTVINGIMFYTISLLLLWVYFWCSNWPPKIFAGVLSFVSYLVIPGWMWFLVTTIVPATIDKKDELKRVNFDIFACMALGLKGLVWNFVFLLPPMLVAGGLAFAMVLAGQPIAGLIVIGIVYLLTMMMFPLVMTHMSMPVQVRAWLSPMMLPILFKNFKPALFWSAMFIATAIIPVSIQVTSNVLYGRQTSELVTLLEERGAAARREAAEAEAEANPAPDSGATPIPGETPVKLEDMEKPDWSIMAIPLALNFTALSLFSLVVVFNARCIGLIAFYFKRDLELVAREKEVKYVSKKVGDKDGPEVEKTAGIAIMAVTSLLAGVGVMIALGAASGDMTSGMIPGLMVALIMLPIGFAMGGMYLAIEKAQLPGWSIFIPIYNIVVLVEMAGKPAWWVLLFFVPVVSIIASILVMVEIAKAFGKDGLFAAGLIILPVVFWPILGFGSAKYKRPQSA